MKRRDLLKGTSAVVGSVALAGAPAIVGAANKIQWKMVTAWPKNFPGLGTGANFLANLITEMSGGELEVKVYGAGELVPPFEVFDAVSKGTAQMGHAVSYYWKGKTEASQFFTCVPFGLNAQEMNSWLYHGGGLELWQELYAPYSIVPAAGGNSGTQMAGWFNKEINSLEDLKGLKMRIPGFAGDVFKRIGGTPVTIPAGEIFTALKSGVIDAAEWVSPYNDLAFGLYKAAKYYYYPGWHEPGPALEVLINETALKQLPKDMQSIVMNACRVANADMEAEFTARNSTALTTLKEKHGVQVKQLPDDVLRKLHQISTSVVQELASKDKMAGKIHESVVNFQQQSSSWLELSEHAYMLSRRI
ncbi:MAG: TRAP transporter substrate-binding protein DctP [Gammaproteobacteria bacterium]|nr:TRAP transporter substrate-binding protein DctP [Gammaproteobacteria bacterium]